MNDQVSPLVSVVIPTFNHGHYLGRALQSIIDQAYTNWEAIVIDNHSTDNTAEVISAYSDKRIKYLRFFNNGVIGASRNIGIRSAKGEWIAFLDSDDWWHPNKLKEFQVHIANNLDVFYHELEVIRPGITGRQKLIGSWQVRPPVQIDLLMRGNAIATSSVVVRREVLNRTSLFNESHSMIACEDYNLWLQVGGISNNFYYHPLILGYYMDDGKGASRKDLSEPYKHAIDTFVYKLNSSQKQYVEARVNYHKLRYAYLNKDYALVADLAIKSIENGPASIRAKSVFMYYASVIKSMYFR